MERDTGRNSGRTNTVGRLILRSKPLFLGAGVGVTLISVHFLVEKATSVVIASILLAVIAGAYFGFAVADGRPRMIVVEIFSCLLFGSAAVAGLLWSPLAIPLAVICHGLWDITHLLPWFRGGVPHGYPLFCLAVDVVFGGILLFFCTCLLIDIWIEPIQHRLRLEHLSYWKSPPNGYSSKSSSSHHPKP